MLRVGGIAQLEELLLCKQGVSGSSPLTSTISEEAGLAGRATFAKTLKTSAEVSRRLEIFDN